MNKILLIDDENTNRILLGKILSLEGYEVRQAEDRFSALAALRKNNDVQVIICDVFLPDGNGVDMVPELQKMAPEAKIILLTGHGNIADGVQAIKNGAFDYLIKGDDNRKIIPLVSRAMDEAAKGLKGRNAVKKEEKWSGNGFTSVIGRSTSIQQVVAMAKKVAASDICVLLTGETGTGKEVFAKAIHQESPRKDKPFLAINCSAFSKELLESELFGHKAGSFTGALKDKKGLFEEANGGTIFLDEVGEMEFSLQAKLLRVLESSEFIKVGDTRTTKVDVRIIAATNRDLKKEIDLKQFREDLYFRLSVFQLELPPLRERKGDVRLLAQYFIDRFSQKMRGRQIGIQNSCFPLMEAYSWPGNIRELRNVIERALIVCDDEIVPDDLPLDLQMVHPASTATGEFDLATVERNHIAKILSYTHGNKTETARLLKIGLTTLYRKIEEYGIQV